MQMVPLRFSEPRAASHFFRLLLFLTAQGCTLRAIVNSAVAPKAGAASHGSKIDVPLHNLVQYKNRLKEQ